MSSELPVFIDPLRLAQREETLQGQYPLAAMPRLCEALHRTEGVTDFCWHFSLDNRQRPLIYGTLQASVWLICQRCMQPFEWWLESTIALIVLTTGAAEEEIPDGFEVLNVAANTPPSLQDCVEDGLILSLPLIARHEFCPHNEYTMPATDVAVEQSDNPFDVLKKLQKK